MTLLSVVEARLPDSMLACPALDVTSAMFVARRYGPNKRPFVHGMKEAIAIPSLRDKLKLLELRQTMGWRLDQADKDVWLELLQRAAHQDSQSVWCQDAKGGEVTVMGVMVTVKPYELLRAVGRSTGGGDRAWLDGALERLRTAEFVWRTPGLADNTMRLVHLSSTPLTESGEYRIVVDATFARWYVHGWAAVSLPERVSLGSHYLAKFLHSYAAGFDSTVPSVSIANLMRATGYEPQDPAALTAYKKDLAAYRLAMANWVPGARRPSAPKRPSGMTISDFVRTVLKPELAVLQETLAWSWDISKDNKLALTKPAGTLWSARSDVETPLSRWLLSCHPVNLVTSWGDAPSLAALKRALGEAYVRGVQSAVTRAEGRLREQLAYLLEQQPLESVQQHYADTLAAAKAQGKRIHPEPTGTEPAAKVNLAKLPLTEVVPGGPGGLEWTTGDASQDLALRDVVQRYVGGLDSARLEQCLDLYFTADQVADAEALGVAGELLATKLSIAQAAQHQLTTQAVRG